MATPRRAPERAFKGNLEAKRVTAPARAREASKAGPRKEEQAGRMLPQMYRRPPTEVVFVVFGGPPVPLPAGWRLAGRARGGWFVERPVAGDDTGNQSGAQPLRRLDVSRETSEQLDAQASRRPDVQTSKSVC